MQNLINLALYSDQIIPENSAIDIRLVELMASRGGGGRIAYVPSGPEPDRDFFQQTKLYYAKYGLDLSLFYDPSEPHTAEERAKFFASDAIHLTGGHTGDFLQRLRLGGLLGPLRDWALQGGMLIGTSAGAILMTPTIAVDALFSGRKPEEVRDGSALDLVPFEFFPHLNDSAAYLDMLLLYSRQTPRPIVAVRDGDGIVVTGGLVECFGNPVWIWDGAVRPASEMELAGFAISAGR
jgi:dipeptidase E